MNTNGSPRKRNVSAAGDRRPIKVTPRRKQKIDPHLISLCYFLIAQRIVREADKDEVPAPSADAGDDDRPSGRSAAASSEHRS